MIIRLVTCFLFSLLAPSLFSQTQYGIGKKQEVIDAYESLSIQYDTTRTPQKTANLNGHLFSNFYQKANTFNLTRKDKWDLSLLAEEYHSFIDKPESLSSKKNSIFFKNGHLYTFQNDEVYLKIDPLLYFSIGADKESEPTPFRNTRGVSISGHLQEKVFFRTSILENQARYLPHIERRISDRNAIPGQGFYKRYESGFIKSISGWDYLNAEGVLTYRPSNYFRASIGHGSFFLGSGYNSLLLSDYADNFFFVEFNTSIGIFNYKNIFAELAPIGSTIDQVGDPLAPKKYMATHYLSVALSNKLELSLFESVIFGRENNFEFQYLNPLILYRVVEQKLDSPDNVMIGLDVSYKLNNQTKLYSQVLIDEMRIKEAFNGSGWWGNKVGFQLGAKSYDLFGIDHLNMQVEYNSVRPFTYSHRRSEGLDYTVASYSHYNQELAHPLGANFREALLLLDYRLDKKWSLSNKLIVSKVGKSLTDNVGQDILLPSDSRLMDFENKTGQGEETSIFQVSSTLTRHIGHGLYADAMIIHRNESSASSLFNVKSTYFAVSFRANVSHRKLDY